MAQTVLLFANNARSTLSGSITAVGTSATLATGTGVLFPNPNNAIGEYFKLTFTDQATGLLNEIVHVTAVVGDVVTIVRAQEGTSALAWNAGDFAVNMWTKDSANAMLQAPQVQNNSINHVTATGTSDAITATYTPAYTAWVDGMTFFVKIGTTNVTTTPTVSPNGLAAKTIVKGAGTALRIGDQAVGMIAEYKFSSTLDQVILQNPMTGNAGLIASNIQIVTATGTIPASIAGGTLVINSASATNHTLPSASTFAAGKRIEFFNINTGVATVSRAGTDTLQVNNSTVNSLDLGVGDTLTLMSDGISKWYAVGGANQLKYSNVFKNGSGYCFLPDGTLIQRGIANFSTAGTVNTFPIAFPASVDAISYAYTGVSGLTSIVSTITSSTTQFTTRSSANTGSYNYIAIGK